MENNVYSLRYNCLELDAFLPSMLVCFECLVFGFFLLAVICCALMGINVIKALKLLMFLIEDANVRQMKIIC